jgi:hypothetical protein
MGRSRQAAIEERLRRVLDDLLGGDGASHLDRAVAADAIASVAERMCRVEVMSARDFDGSTWEQVGHAFGMTRQSAHERFRAGPDGLHSRMARKGDAAARRSSSGRSAKSSTTGRRRAAGRK